MTRGAIRGHTAFMRERGQTGERCNAVASERIAARLSLSQT